MVTLFCRACQSADARRTDRMQNCNCVKLKNKRMQAEEKLDNSSGTAESQSPTSWERTTAMLQKCFLIFFCFWTVTGCVSVQLGPGKAGRASGVTYSNPAVPFQKISDGNADMAWQSSKTSNTISFFSECPQSEAALDAIAEEFHSVLKSPKMVERKNNFFNGREALWTQTEGKLDGIEMKIASTVFRRNGCSYLLTYVARKDRFNDEYSAFMNFTEGFRAP